MKVLDDNLKCFKYYLYSQTFVPQMIIHSVLHLRKETRELLKPLKKATMAF